MDESFNISEYQAEFIVQAIEQIEDIEIELFSLEKSSAPNEIFRSIKMKIHSIKGSAGTFDFDLLGTICHSFEDYLTTINLKAVNTENVEKMINYNRLMKDYLEIAHNLSGKIIVGFKERLDAIEAKKNDINFKVLIVEQSKTLRSIYKKILDHMGVRISILSDSYDALGRLLKEHFDSMIITNKVGSIDGLQLVESLKIIDIQNKNLDIVFVTSNKNITEPSYKLCTIIQKDEGIGRNISQHYAKLIASKEEPQKSPKQFSKILCIDDDKLLHRVIDISLRTFPGIESRFCLESINAIQIIEEFQPDLILLDVMMEGMTGPEIIENLSKEGKLQTHPVIFLTGKSRQEEIDELLALGCIGVIAKPFKPNDLNKKISQIWYDFKNK